MNFTRGQPAGTRRVPSHDRAEQVFLRADSVSLRRPASCCRRGSVPQRRSSGRAPCKPAAAVAVSDSIEAL